MHKGKILLVEDNEDDVLLTKRAFKRKHIYNELIVAEDGEEALDYLFGENGKDKITPILILLDLKIPKLDGLEVLREVKSRRGTVSIPVVILSTSTEEEDIIKSYESGASSYIRKPVDFEQFLNAVEQLGVYWLAINKPAPMHAGPSSKQVH